MKFIHTSDWHLGRQFHHVSLLDDQAAVLAQLVDLLRENPVDALIIAGDIYDRSVPPASAIALLDQVVEQICGELNTPIIMIPGNHDGAQRLGFAAKQLKGAGLHIISDFEHMLTPVVLSSAEAGEVAFYGIPYTDPEWVRHHFDTDVSSYDQAHGFVVEQIKAVRAVGQKAVLVSHCFVDGGEVSDSERPLSIGGSERVSHEHFKVFDYVALGHLHQPQRRGEDYIRYSGSLMKYSFSEQHQQKGVSLVTLDETGFVSAEHLPLDAPHQMRIIEGELATLLAQGKDDSNAHDYILARLTDKHAILNPMDKLRQVYPNVLHLEKPGMLIGVEQNLAQAKLARSELDMFKDFFKEAQNAELNDVQEQALGQLIQGIRHKEASL